MFPPIHRFARRAITRLAARRHAAESGAVVVIFAISLVPVFALVGAAIDYSRVVAARARLQAATDAAVLAGAQESLVSERNKIAGNVLTASLADANFDGSGHADMEHR